MYRYSHIGNGDVETAVNVLYPANYIGCYFNSSEERMADSMDRRVYDLINWFSDEVGPHVEGDEDSNAFWWILNSCTH